MWFSPSRRALSLNNARASRIEGGSFSKCGYRLSAAHGRLKHCKSLLHGLRVSRFQNVALALAPHALVLK
eukprot:8021517-Pyramimonas_sp.AAC.1